jgi:small conductance mechanosensitive channel
MAGSNDGRRRRVADETPTTGDLDTVEALSENLEKNLDQSVEQASAVVDALVAFGVEYGFQILGALVFLLIGLRFSSWLGRRVARVCEGRNLDVTLSKFIGSVVKVVMIGFMVVITLGNFGITIAPLIALAGASAFGATVAIQGPLSNYGAGLSIILARPFVVGNTIQVQSTFGVVKEISLAHTLLEGEDGELILVPNKEIVGQVIVNSQDERVVETKIAIAPDADTDAAIAVLRDAIAAFPEVNDGAKPQVGIHDFAFGAVVLGVRFWVPSLKYFHTRYRVNEALRAALIKKNIPLARAAVAQTAPDLSSDGVT